MKKQKTLLVFLSILSIVALLAVLSSPQLLGYFQNKRQSEAEQENIREQQAAREMAAKGIAEYNGLTIELTRTSLIHNINDTGIKEEDFCVSQIILSRERRWSFIFLMGYMRNCLGTMRER